MEKLCKHCELNVATKYSKYTSGEFCSINCSRSFSTKKKRKEINEKVSKALTGKIKVRPIKKKCLSCKNVFFVKTKKKHQKYCSSICVKTSKEYRNKITLSSIERSKSIEERARLREIGRKGGFGKKGYTTKGIYYQSTFEKNVFEYLDQINVDYVPHRNIPNSSKISDLYITKLDLWIELDGIDREKKKRWIGKDYDYWIEKIRIYDDQKLNYQIIKTFNEFKNKIVT